MLEVIEYNLLLGKIDESSLIDSIMSVYQKAFKGKSSKYIMRRWINKQVKRRKEKLFLCVDLDTNKLYGYCVLIPTQKQQRNVTYDKYVTTHEYGFISDLCSIKKGCGSMLLNHIINTAFPNKDLVLTIGKKSLLKYYAKFGFQPKTIGRRILARVACH